MVMDIGNVDNVDLVNDQQELAKEDMEVTYNDIWTIDQEWCLIEENQHRDNVSTLAGRTKRIVGREPIIQ